MTSDATAVDVRRPKAPARQLAAFKGAVVLRGETSGGVDTGGRRAAAPVPTYAVQQVDCLPRP